MAQFKSGVVLVLALFVGMVLLMGTLYLQVFARKNDDRPISRGVFCAFNRNPSCRNVATPSVTPSPQTASSSNQLTLPLRAAFYYAWYPEQWSSAGHRYKSVLGEYDSSDTTVIDKHIDQMKYGKIDVGIYSWWADDNKANSRFAKYLDRAETKDFKWAVLYELDYKAGRSLEQIAADMTYLQANYFNRPGYLRLDGKPVIFVYQPSNGGCVTVEKWTKIKNKFNLYISMQDVPEWWTCNTLDSWFRYKPDNYVVSVYLGDNVYSISASVGFNAAWESTERLARDFTMWETAVSLMVQYKPKWQLVYFNEFGEGTAIEPSDALCKKADCLDYLEVLRQNK